MYFSYVFSLSLLSTVLAQDKTQSEIPSTTTDPSLPTWTTRVGARTTFLDMDCSRLWAAVATVSSSSTRYIIECPPLARCHGGETWATVDASDDVYELQRPVPTSNYFDPADGPMVTFHQRCSELRDAGAATVTGAMCTFWVMENGLLYSTSETESVPATTRVGTIKVNSGDSWLPLVTQTRGTDGFYTDMATTTSIESGSVPSDSSAAMITGGAAGTKAEESPLECMAGPAVANAFLAPWCEPESS